MDLSELLQGGLEVLRDLGRDNVGGLGVLCTL
jgi:hypothetical protein